VGLKIREAFIQGFRQHGGNAVAKMRLAYDLLAARKNESNSKVRRPLIEELRV
jgi:hypothetical protein